MLFLSVVVTVVSFTCLVYFNSSLLFYVKIKCTPCSKYSQIVMLSTGGSARCWKTHQGIHMQHGNVPGRMPEVSSFRTAIFNQLMAVYLLQTDSSKPHQKLVGSTSLGLN